MSYQEWNQLEEDDLNSYFTDECFEDWQKDHDQLTAKLNKANELIKETVKLLSIQLPSQTAIQIEQDIKTKLKQYLESIKEEVK